MSELLQEELDGQEDLQDVACFDDASAEYLLQRIREANAQFDRMEAWYAHQLNKAMEIRDRTIAWAERSLRAYLDMVPAKKTKTQMSYELPGGKLILKQQAPEYDRNDEALLPWMKQNGYESLVKVKESVNWAELKKTLTETPDGTGMMTTDGEVVPGIKVEQREPKFSVDLKEKIK